MHRTAPRNAARPANTLQRRPVAGETGSETGGEPAGTPADAPPGLSTLGAPPDAPPDAPSVDAPIVDAPNTSAGTPVEARARIARRPTDPALHVAGEPDFAAPITTLQDLWAEAVRSPDRPVVGTVHDGTAEWVACAVQFCHDEGTVVMDYPSDSLLETVRTLARDGSWHVAYCRAIRFRRDGPIRYVVTLCPRTRITDEQDEE